MSSLSSELMKNLIVAVSLVRLPRYSGRITIRCEFLVHMTEGRTAMNLTTITPEAQLWTNEDEPVTEEWLGIDGVVQVERSDENEVSLHLRSVLTTDVAFSAGKREPKRGPWCFRCGKRQPLPALRICAKCEAAMYRYAEPPLTEADALDYRSIEFGRELNAWRKKKALR